MGQTSLHVDCQPADGSWLCRVRVGDDERATLHEVGVALDDLVRLAPSASNPQRLVEESFRFMLAREPRESILSRFDLPVIGRYFPEYESDIRRRLDAGG
jgi:hypothetical protein